MHGCHRCHDLGPHACSAAAGHSYSGTKLLHCKKKVSDFPVPSRDVANQTLPWSEIIKLFPAMESLVNDIPAWDGKTANLF
jgi:hypothetical protein